MKLAWKDEYDLGIASIDAQHRNIIGIINDLTDLMERGVSGDGISEAVSKMRRYAEEHLAYEENLFSRCGYAETDEHREEHDVFRETIEEFHARSKRSDPVVAIEMLGYLEGWLLKHILVTDRKYVETFRIHDIR